MPAPDGRLMRTERGDQGNVVVLAAAFEEMGLASPRDLPARQGLVVCHVDDVDAHCAQAKAAGA